MCRRDERGPSVGILISKKIRFYKAVQNFLILFLCEFAYKYSLLCSMYALSYISIYYSTAQHHCPLTRRPEPARTLIVNI